ncbi:MAG: hypothetical protein JXR37_02700 [Kiritimatiellae bacterium]|nr:hypothetical protein [Kiritimatiellia bacterium]
MACETAKKRRARLAGAVLVTAVVTALLFLAEDTPEKRYLNPLYLDALVLVAGLGLLGDAFAQARTGRLYSLLLRCVVGAAMTTIHVLQFAFDLCRGL